MLRRIAFCWSEKSYGASRQHASWQPSSGSRFRRKTGLMNLQTIVMHAVSQKVALHSPFFNEILHVTASHAPSPSVSRHCMQLQVLNDDVCSSICSRLDVKSLAAMAQTSRRYAGLIRDQNRIWKGKPVPPLYLTCYSAAASSTPPCVPCRPAPVLQRSATSTAGRCQPRTQRAGRPCSSSGCSRHRSAAGTRVCLPGSGFGH